MSPKQEEIERLEQELDKALQARTELSEHLEVVNARVANLEGETERLMPVFLAALGGDPQPLTVTTDAPGGRYRLRGTVFPVNRYGRNVAVMGITHDVTELHAAAFGAGALRWALDTVEVPVAIFDASTHELLYANPASTQLTAGSGLEPGAAVSWDGLRPSLVEELPEPGGRRQVTVDLDGDDGRRQLDVEIECHAGERTLVVYTAADVTERGRRERELQRAAELERETAQRLVELDRLKNAFVTAVSHELRTPATVIVGVARSLQRLRGQAAADARDDLEDALVRHADRLEQLLADLLDLGRLTHGATRTEPEPFDLVEFQIERIVENLLGNAAKYATGTPVTVTLRARDDGGFCLAVTDEGPGIPAEDLERVFEPFYRGDPDHPQPGTGIGLALVAEFAAIHGGQARAEHVQPGGGTRVVVDIPERRDAAPADATT